MLKFFFSSFGFFLICSQAMYGQEEQILSMEPEIVGEGTISSRDFEFNFSPNKDFDLAFLSKSLLPDWRRISIVYSQKDEGEWTVPQLVPFSGKYRDADPFIFPDQEKLIFISDRPSKYQEKPTDYSLWVVDAPFLRDQKPKLVEGKFHENVSPVYPSVSWNRNLYFSAVDTIKDSDIYVAKPQEGRYREEQKLSFNDSEHYDYDPVIAPDESFIVFVSKTRDGFGGSDLFVSFNEGGKWSDPINLGSKINSFGNEGQPGISTDGNVLFFASTRPKKRTGYSPRERKINNNSFLQELNTPFNGLPNIWKVNISQLKRQ